MSDNVASATDGETHGTIAEIPKISDPGEMNRDQHSWADRIIINIGNVAAWLFPILMIAIIAQVFLRKAGHNQAWLDDMQWWIYGSAMLTGFGYAITTESHVRVDIFHAHFTAKKKARIELFALGWCLLPFLILLTDNMVHYAASSVMNREGANSPNGLHMLYLLKSLLPILLTLAMIASVSVMYRHMKTLAKPALWNMLIAGFPAAWFAAERFVHYALWWFVRLTDSEINPRRISKSDLLQPAMWYGLALVLILIVVSFAITRRNAEKV